MTHEETGKGTYQKFMNTHYSSTTILILILGNFFLNECIFRDFGPYSFAAQTPSTYVWWSCFSFLIRLVMCSTLCFIWGFKTVNENASSALRSWLLLAQAIFPVMMNTVFAVFILIDLCSGSYSGLRDFFQYSPTYFAQFGLQVYPIVTCFLLRDTHPTAVLISWLIALVTMLLCCIYTQSLSELFSLVTYAVSSATLLLDNYRQNKALYAVVTKLEDTLRDNERLAVEAQALELRAMIGNVAHDLKTVM